ncbi:hypothetical protein [Saccharibacillus brassicae]|uniref:Uncharacterized protein n=1 Tax=Saccharibacillus brassicae TaxID=2583377 RepID=A0A4Y6UZK1_SACBS|nr:hypothetical protein [Saccharibacillus brassicae]QDH22010.1 hypothetical protein FFV09_14870 [Saccharibacillus brassicae]
MRVRRSVELTLVVAIAALLVAYFFFFNLSSNLRTYGFEAGDAIVDEGYSTDAEHPTKLMLLANEERMGIVVLDGKGLGVWEHDPIVSILENPQGGEFASVYLPILKDWGEQSYTEKHVFASAYVEIDERPFVPNGPDFYVHADYFDVNGRTLLYAHAMSDEDVFGEEQVIAHLREQLGLAEN